MAMVAFENKWQCSPLEFSRRFENLIDFAVALWENAQTDTLFQGYQNCNVHRNILGMNDPHHHRQQIWDFKLSRVHPLANGLSKHV